MDCERKLIYFSTYENGVKISRAGYAGIFIRENVCDVQIYYRETGESGGQTQRKLYPVYVFCDGTVIEGTPLFLEEGMAAVNIRTVRSDFMQSGRTLEELEVIYIDGVARGICGGRPDGQEIITVISASPDEEDRVAEPAPACEQKAPVPAKAPKEWKQEKAKGISSELWMLALLFAR